MPNILDTLSAAAGGSPSPDASANAAAAAAAGKPADAAPTTTDATKTVASADKTTLAAGASADTTGKADAGKADAAKAEEAPLTDEQLKAEALKALGIKATAETAEDYKARFAGLKQTHDSLAQRVKAQEAFFAGKGLKLLETKDGYALIADDKYAAETATPVASEVYASLTQAEKEMAIEKPEELTKLIAAKIIAKVQPAKLDVKRAGDVVEISDATKALLRVEAAQAKTADGKALLPDYETLAPFIDELMAGGRVSDDLKQFMNSSPERYREINALLFSEVFRPIAPLIAMQRERQARLDAKKVAATGDVSLTAGSGGGSPASAGGGDADDQARRAIMGAKAPFSRSAA